LNQSSRLGRLLDPVADKLLLVTTFVAISVPGFGFEPLPWWLAAAAILRDVGIVAVGYAIYARTGFSGFTPTLLGKAHTVCELIIVGLFLLSQVVWVPSWLVTMAIWLTLASVLVSGCHYVFHVRRQLAALPEPDQQ
jgi:cardiolipin synthase